MFISNEEQMNKMMKKSVEALNFDEDFEQSFCMNTLSYEFNQ